MDVAEHSLWSHQIDDKEGFKTVPGLPAVELDNKPSESRLGDLLSRFYFIIPLIILASIPAVEYIVKDSFELTLPNILIVLASIMCLVTWSMRINTGLSNLMPVVISGIASTALAMLIVSQSPDLNMHAAASMMILIVWLTSAPRINLYVQSTATLLIIAGLSYLLVTSNFSTQNLITVFALLLSGVMMGVFSQVHRHIHANDNVPEELLSGDL
ncbi:MAG: hypothetical protein KAU21_11190, partial [Gammaproteobacteria bacterium]|nr:hypothetical protein [Gammaproteobacteria bacterium]